MSLFWVSHDLLPGQTGDNSFTIYKITESWQENSVTWNNQPSISNENLVFVPKSNSSSQSYREINITAFVQRMIVNPSENHGFMLWLDEELPYKSIVIASSDHPDQTKHPKLVVYY